MIDLHLHTTASDGCVDPEPLVARLAAEGIRAFAVTDHDTVAGLPAVAAAAARYGLAWIPGIEITAVEDERDIHVLAYGFDAASPALAVFLAEQRASRLDRLREYERRFAALGVPVDLAPVIAQAAAGPGRPVGRAHVARRLVAAGQVASIAEAFDRWLSPGRPAFVPRRGAPVAEVVEHVEAAGGIASLAHPALIRNDRLVERLLKTAGLHALEAYHSEHDAADTGRYLNWAAQHDLVVTGGTDFHGDTAGQPRRLGQVSLPPEAFEALRRRAAAVSSGFLWPEGATA